MTPSLPQDSGSWLMAGSFIVASITSAWAVSKNQTVKGLRGDIGDLQKRVDIKDGELKDRESTIKGLTAENSELKTRQDYSKVIDLNNGILVLIQQTKQQSEEQFKAFMEMFRNISDHMKSSNQEMSQLASQIRLLHEAKVTDGKIPTTRPLRTRKTDLKD